LRCGATDRDGSRGFCTSQRCWLSRGFPSTDVEKMPNRDPKEQQEFDRLVAIINEGVTVWNDWRDSHPGMAIDLSDVQLRSADLRGAELRFDHPLWIGWLLAGMVSLFGANNWLVYIVLYAVTGVSFGHLYCSRHWRTGFLVGLPLFFWSLLTPGRVTISAITLAVSTLSVRVGGLLDIETKHVLSRDRSQLKVPTGDTIRYRARKGDQLTSVIANITKDGKPIEEAYLLSRSHRVTCYVIELQDGELIAPHLVAFN